MIPYPKEIESLIESLPVLVWTKNPEGEKEYFNQRWTDYSGLSANNKAWDWTDLIHPDEHDMAVSYWDKSLATGNLYEFECRLKRYDGVYRWHVARAIPVFNSNKEIILWSGVCLDIHENKSKEQELVEKNKELFQTYTDLDNFVYTASHDLKTPIVNLEALVEALKEESCNDKDCHHKKLLEMIEQSIEKLKGTINDLTEITKVQREITDDIELLSISENLNEVQSDLNKIIEESGVTFHYNLKADKLCYSKRNLKIILYNLISNSIKFRSPDGNPEVNISSFKKGNQLVLSVQDNGIGIDLANVGKLFHMFKKLNAHVEGSGIGLYIVKRIIENNGGRIEVESKVGKGATFKVYFKLE